VVVELRETRRVAVTLLDTYVGPRAGAKILDGWVRRGDLEIIDAVVLCGDLRGFTPLAMDLSPRETVAMLNDYFETVCGPLRDAGGEILKFIGDGVLAAFPYTGDVNAACTSALGGAGRSLAALEALPPRQVAGRDVKLRMGIALHIGQVAFGNIGSSSRLDFTVIGHAVNVASRLAGLCSRLDRSLLVSAAFAAEVPTGAVQVGTHAVRGLPAEQAVYTYEAS
jgi:adenylate cyclase